MSNQSLGLQGYGNQSLCNHIVPTTAAEIRGFAVSSAKQRIIAIQLRIDELPSLQDEHQRLVKLLKEIDHE